LPGIGLEIEYWNIKPNCLKTSRRFNMTEIMPIERIEKSICLIRGQKVILDRDLAAIYGVPTFRFNEAVKRNLKRFPEDFMFRITHEEVKGLISQNAMSKPGRGGRRTLPYAFTEHGAIMAANLLNSPRAVQMSVFVVRAFIRMRSMMKDKGELSRRLSMLEKELKERLDVHETAIISILQRIMDIIDPPELPGPTRKTIGFQIKESNAKYGKKGKG
jgi:hypothetical protein